MALSWDTVLANEVQVVGNFYLRTHLALNRKYCNWGSYRLFHVRPKLHMLFHVLDSCNTGKNPCSDACWMEEDWIRRVAKLARMTHIKTAERSTLQRYVAGHVFFLRSSLPLRCEFLGRTEVCNPGCEAEEVPGLAGLASGLLGVVFLSGEANCVDFRRATCVKQFPQHVSVSVQAAMPCGKFACVCLFMRSCSSACVHVISRFTCVHVCLCSHMVHWCSWFSSCSCQGHVHA